MDKDESWESRQSHRREDFVWALDSSNDSIFNLFIHIKDFGEKLFLEKKIEFRGFCSVPDDYALPFGHGRQINLIFKEAMTNAFKYSGASNVEFGILKENNSMVFSLRDNGIGVSPDKLTLLDGGFANMRVRSKRICSDLVTTSHENAGLEILLVVNI